MSLSDTLRNGVPRLLLRSPAHGLLSARYCLLEFRGRTSGAAYLVPVAYVVREGTLLMSTDSRLASISESRPNSVLPSA